MRTLGADFGSATIKMVGSLLLVLGLIVCLFYWIRRLRFGSVSSGPVPRMRLVGALNLAPKRAVALIEICDQWLLVGIGTENVTLISRIDPVSENERARETAPEGERSFQSMLRESGLLRAWKSPTARGKDDEA